MLSFKNYLFVVSSEKPGNLEAFGSNLYSNCSPVKHRDHFCFFHGSIHNMAELAMKYNLMLPSTEALLIELYLTSKITFASSLQGSYSLVIGNSKEIYILRDGNGFENIYYALPGNENPGLIVTNSIKEVLSFRRLEVNTDVLPGYFIKTDLNSGETFFKDFYTLSFFEEGLISLKDFSCKKRNFDDFFTLNEIKRDIRIKDLIKGFDDLFSQLMTEKTNQLKQQFPIVNALSGGTDSTFIQYFLSRENINKAYTANYLNAGLDHIYASDVSNLMGLDQKTVQSDVSWILGNLQHAIWISEKPQVFSGESLLFHMYEEIHNDLKQPAACFDGTGAEGILGASRILYELRIIRKYGAVFPIILPFLRIYSGKLYSRYKEFYQFVNRKDIPRNFILRYFTDPLIRNTVKVAFKLDSLEHIDDYETGMMKRYNVILFESVYRYLAFELEFRRVINIRTQLAKYHDINLALPFTDSRLYKFLISYDTEFKLRKAKTKYIFRKAMEKKFPSHLIYRKKIRKNFSISGELLQNKEVKQIISEIQLRNYSYFNFDYQEIFSNPAFNALSYKLINFHLWHKAFIDVASNTQTDHNPDK